MVNSLAIGLGTKDKKLGWLEFFFVEPCSGIDDKFLNQLKKIITIPNQTLSLNDDKVIANLLAILDKTNDQHKKLIDFIAQATKKASYLSAKNRQLVAILLTDDVALSDVGVAYLKLHLLSYRHFKPNELNLTNIFSVLPNVAWSNKGPINPANVADELWKARFTDDALFIRSIDKFPRLTDYVIPANVRIANSARIRLGAYLGSGTTVMHEGFINFNAGTQGPNMVEGRISAGVWVDENSDLGGGASTMGRLSGGGDILISVGKNCLIGANAGLGIPLGDNCIIESGLYVTAGSKLKVLSKDGVIVSESVKASQLSGKDNLLIRRNSLNGQIECLTTLAPASLNAELHKNN